ncbi:hypothetical protein Q5O89_07015 [Peribacillus frigoritolerans]|nr:hypothetical protein [Peribacillus frigoritolerans]
MKEDPADFRNPVIRIGLLGTIIIYTLISIVGILASILRAVGTSSMGTNGEQHVI